MFGSCSSGLGPAAPADPIVTTISQPGGRHRVASPPRPWQTPRSGDRVGRLESRPTAELKDYIRAGAHQELGGPRLTLPAPDRRRQGSAVLLISLAQGVDEFLPVGRADTGHVVVARPG